MKPTKFIPLRSLPLKTTQRNPDSYSAEPTGNHGQPSNIRIQCIMKKREESHGIVKKWWSSLIMASGLLETSHMEEIMIYFIKMYNKKDSTYAVLLESFQMLSVVNASTEQFPILDTGITMYCQTCSASSSKNGNNEYHAEETMTEHSGSPKPTQGTFEVPAIKTKVNPKDFTHMKLFVKSSLQYFQKLMKEKLCDHMKILEVFRRDSPFGAFLDVQLVPPPAMLWQLMVREANVEGAKEKYDKDSLPVFVKENWSKSVVCYTSVVERFSKLCRLLDDEGKKEYALQWIVKVVTLMFVVLVLIGQVTPAFRRPGSPATQRIGRVIWAV
ncbi:unnamed protein product [Cuscuta campestris]|uniref:Uncharacterized protein n=1 Tax=Cuscuta campestris TaxID=132261 RepID=A0A484MVI8_9ASTE|nr:unnamed protein product [Cuscuta campestris]